MRVSNLMSQKSDQCLGQQKHGAVSSHEVFVKLV